MSKCTRCGMHVRAPLLVVMVAGAVVVPPAVEVQRRRHGVGSSALEDKHARMHFPHGSLLPSTAVKAA
jgi:hypothetical protein